MKLNEIGSHYDQPVTANLKIMVSNKKVEAFRNFFNQLENKYKEQGVVLTKWNKQNRLVYKVFPVEITGVFLVVKRIVNDIFTFLQNNTSSEVNRLHYDDLNKQVIRDLNNKARHQETEYQSLRGHISDLE